MTWIIDKNALAITADLLGLPRAWGSTVQHGGADDGVFKRRLAGSNRHSSLTPEAFGYLINKGWSIQVSVSNYDGTQYTGFQRFAIYDLDSDTPDLCKRALELLCLQKDACGVHYLNTDSGKKGYHSYDFFDASVHQDDVRKFQALILSSLAEQVNTKSDGKISGFIQEGISSWYWIPPEHPWNPSVPIKGHPSVHIELLIGGGDGFMIKSIFSRHQKDPTRLSLPMTLAQIKKQDRSQPVTEPQIRRAENLIRRTKRNSYKKILQLIGARERAEPRPKQGLKFMDWARKGRTLFTIPEPEEDIARLHAIINRDSEQEQELRAAIELKNRMRDTTSEIIGRILNVPCLDRCFQISISRPGIYWERTNLVMALARMGYTREEIAYFIRHEINDDADNANRGINEFQTDYWHKRQWRARCEYWQELKSKNHCCDVPCGRRSPDQLEPDPEFPQLTRAADFEETYDKCNEILDMDAKVIVVPKTTRSGFTTALPITGAGRGLRVLFIVPRTSISERTFPDAIHVARVHKFLSIKGFVWSSNMKSCLIRAQQAQDHLHRTGNELRPSIPVPREDCNTCHYSLKLGGKRVLPVLDQPLVASTLTPPGCMQETFRAEKDTYDVGFITYAKLYSLLNNPTEDAEEMRQYINSFDVIVLDEVSQFVESSPLEIVLRKVPTDDSPTYNFFYSLNREMRKLLNHFPTNYIVEEMVEYIDRFTLQCKQTDKFQHGDVLANFLTPDEIAELRLNMNPYLMLLYGFEYDTGNKVSRIYNVLSLLCEESWITSRVETLDYSEETSFVVPPKNKEMIEWIQQLDGKIVITDATMPFTKLDWLFPGVVEYEFGDPNQTSPSQRIIADSKTVKSQFIFTDEYRLRNWVDPILTQHGAENVLVVLPSKKGAERFKRMFPEIPPENVTYQRSNETIGVACNLRVLLVIGAPYAPINAFDWVSTNLVGDNSLSGSIWSINARNTFVQTIGRVKDPLGKVLSAVYCYGIRGQRVEDLMRGCSWTPAVIEVPRQTDHDMHVTIGAYWFNMGHTNFNAHDIRILHMWRRGIDMVTIKDKMKDHVSANFVDTASQRLRLDEMVF